ncbi:glycogen synthase [Candidatus Gottesmanbacteria bacterium]|nr:glycogen synthase [Candidatus Gottesmanbacteria bacterium]
MKVLFVTSEVATVFKLGGLGDVSYALPAALRRLGVDIRIALPFYARINPNRFSSGKSARVKLKGVKCIGPLAVSWDSRRELVFVFAARLGDTRVPLLLFRHPILDEYKAHGHEDLPAVFAFFCQTVATYITVEAMKGESFDIIHCNDWHTALLPLLLGESPKVFFRNGHTHASILPKETLSSQAVRSILTIHNPVYHGIIGESLIQKIALDRRQFHVLRDGGTKYINLIREGLEYADVITTVSPTFAREMLSQNYGPHVTAILKQRKDRLVGILNGLDTTLWDPKHDPNLSDKYSIKNVHTIKLKLKAHMRQSLKLPEVNVPVFGFVGRLDKHQKGLDILLEATEKLLKKRVIQLVMLGTGVPPVVKAIEKVQAKYPESFAFIHTFDERLARRIYAGSDVLLVPSKYEPCGLTQMIAMRYGTIPLVRKTGGLADTVEDGVTGFVFEKYQASALASSMERATRAWQEPKRWQKMVKTAMRQDFSWKRSAREYLGVYRKLVAPHG